MRRIVDPELAQWPIEQEDRRRIKDRRISMFGRTNWQFRTFTLNPETGVFRYYAEKSTKPRGALQLVPCSTFSEEMPKAVAGSSEAPRGPPRSRARRASCCRSWRRLRGGCV